MNAPTQIGRIFIICEFLLAIIFQILFLIFFFKIGQKFEFKFAIFENDQLTYWENLPSNCNRKYDSCFARVYLIGTFGDLNGEQIIEKKSPSFSNIPSF